MKLKKISLFVGTVAILFLTTNIAAVFPWWSLLYSNATITCEKKWVGIGWEGFGIGGKINKCKAGPTHADGTMSPTVTLTHDVGDTADEYYGCQAKARELKKDMTLEGNIYRKYNYFHNQEGAKPQYKAKAPRYCLEEGEEEEE